MTTKFRTVFAVAVLLVAALPNVATATCYGYAGPGGPLLRGPGGGAMSPRGVPNLGERNAVGVNQLDFAG